MEFRHYAAVCAIVRDEHLYLREFVAYHYALGFEKFVIYDNERTVDVRKTFKEHVARGTVGVYPVAGRSMQMPSYTQCLAELRGLVRRVAFLDADEFLVLKRHRDVRLLLAEHEQHAGLAAHWVAYGSSGHLRRIDAQRGLGVW